MAREARVVGTIEARGAARRHDGGARVDTEGHQLVDREAHRAHDAPTARGVVVGHGHEVGHVGVVDDAHVGAGRHGMREQRLYVLAVDLEVAPAARDVGAALVLENDETQLLEAARHVVEALALGEQQVTAHDAARVLTRVVHVVLGRVAVGDVGVEGIDARGEAARALDVGLLEDDDARGVRARAHRLAICEIGRAVLPVTGLAGGRSLLASEAAQRKRRKAAGRATAHDEHVALDSLRLHALPPFPRQTLPQADENVCGSR